MDELMRKCDEAVAEQRALYLALEQLTAEIEQTERLAVNLLDSEV